MSPVHESSCEPLFTRCVRFLQHKNAWLLLGVRVRHSYNCCPNASDRTPLTTYFHVVPPFPVCVFRGDDFCPGCRCGRLRSQSREHGHILSLCGPYCLHRFPVRQGIWDSQKAPSNDHERRRIHSARARPLREDIPRHLNPHRMLRPRDYLDPN